MSTEPAVVPASGVPVSDVPTKEINQKRTSKVPLLLAILALVVIVAAFVIFYVIPQQSKTGLNSTPTDNYAQRTDLKDLSTVTDFKQADTVVSSLNQETTVYKDDALGIKLNVPTYMAFSKTATGYVFNYNGKYSMPGTEGDQDQMLILLYKNLDLLSSSFKSTWTPTTELLKIQNRTLQAFSSGSGSASELNCKLYIFNANDGTIGGFCLNASRRFVDPKDGGIAGDSKEQAATDLVTYNAVLDKVLKSIELYNIYTTVTNSKAGITYTVPQKLDSGVFFGKYAAPGTGGEADVMSVDLLQNFDPKSNEPIQNQFTATGETLVRNSRTAIHYATKSIELEDGDCQTYGFTGNDGKQWGLMLCSSRHLYDNAFTGWDFKGLVAAEKLEYDKIISDVINSINFFGATTTPVAGDCNSNSTQLGAIVVNFEEGQVAKDAKRVLALVSNRPYAKGDADLADYQDISGSNLNPPTPRLYSSSTFNYKVSSFSVNGIVTNEPATTGICNVSVTEKRSYYSMPISGPGQTTNPGGWSTPEDSQMLFHFVYANGTWNLDAYLYNYPSKTNVYSSSKYAGFFVR